MKAHIANDELVMHGAVGASFFDDEGLTASDVRAATAGLSGDLTIRLNSGGGDAFEGAAIHAVLSAYEGPKTIIVEGIAASAASLIAMAGDEIVMAEGAMMMIHDPSGITLGTAADHEKQAETLNALADEYAGVYARRSKKTASEARDEMKAEIWLGGEEAVAAGYADRTLAADPITASAFPYQNYTSTPAPIMAMAQDKGWLAASSQIKRAETSKTPAAPVAPKQEVSMSDPITPAGSETPETKPAVIEMTADQKAILGADERRKVVMSINTKDVLTAAQIESVVAETGDVAEAKMKAADLIVDMKLKDEGPETKPSASVTGDAQDRFKTGVTAGLMHRAGMGGERNEFTGMTLRETARMALNIANVKPAGHSALDMVGSAFTMSGGMHAPADFTSILADVANKAMLRGYEEAEETFQQWTVEGSVSDFKPTKRVDLDTFPSLRAVPDGAEYKYATVGDHGETITIATYGELFNISRQTVINDDLSAFTRLPQKMGRAAIRTVGNLAYAVLTDNAAMSDGTALFHASHNNLASSGAAPSVTSFNAAYEAMMKQKDRAENAHALNIMPRFGLFPVSLRSQALQVLESEHDPAKTSRSANTARNMVTPIIDARLTGNGWYFVADPSRIDTVEVSYLDGNSAPFLDQTETWTRDGASFKVRIDAGVKALASQGLYSDPGA